MNISALSYGDHTVSLRGVNATLPGQVETGPAAEIKFKLYSDSPTSLIAPTLTNIGYTDINFQYKIADTDGIRNQLCSVDGQSVAPDANGNCAFKNLKPGTTYSAITTAEVARLQADGTPVWESVKISTPFTTLLAKDSPTTVTLNTTAVTTNSALAACNITDLDGATGTCTLRNKSTGALVASWTIGANHPLTGLTPSTTYTLAVMGTKNILNPDNTISPFSVQELRDFTTDAAGIDSPTTVTLDITNITTNSALAHCNITDLDGAQGTCTLTTTGGTVITTWPI